MKKITLLLPVCILFFNSCKPGTTDPPVDDTPEGRRDYEWTVDTLKSPEALDITRIWGSSPENVWAVGTSSSIATSIWHYDGNTWRCDSAYRPMTPWAIFGFSSNEVWLGTNTSSIWKYDGNSWSPFKEYYKPGYTNIVFQNMYGVSPTQIYAVGYAERYDPFSYTGIVMYYDGNDWKLIDIPDTSVNFIDVRVDIKSNVLVLEGYTEGEGGKVFTWDGKYLKEIYSGGNPAVSNIGDQIVVVIGKKIYKYKDGNLHLWIDKTGSNHNGKIWCGRSEKDFFWNTYNGIAHFNGTDFKVLYEKNFKDDLGINGGIIFEKDVFFLMQYWDNEVKNLIIHGKLKGETE